MADKHKTDGKNTSPATQGSRVRDIQTLAEDRLGMASSAESLARTLLTVQAPFTVAVRGAWGTGKSSILNMTAELLRIYSPDAGVTRREWEKRFRLAGAKKEDGQDGPKAIEKDKRSFWRLGWLWKSKSNSESEPDYSIHYRFHEHAKEVAREVARKEGRELRSDWPDYVIHVFRFNPWAESSLVRDHGTSSLLLRHFIGALQEKGIIDRRSALRLIASFGRQGSRMAFMLAKARIGGVPIMHMNVPGSLRRDQRDAAAQADQLRKELSRDLEAALKAQRGLRLVFLLDDLDRLDPEQAVAMLDTVTTLLTLPGCLFVAALDQDTLQHGVRRKFDAGATGDDAVARLVSNYFDKTFNVSIRMSRSLSGSNMTGLIKSLDLFENDDQLTPVIDIIKYTSGGVPRTAKRLERLCRLRADEFELSLGKDDEGTRKLAEQRRLAMGLAAIEERMPHFHRWLRDQRIEEGGSWSDRDSRQIRNKLMALWPKNDGKSSAEDGIFSESDGRPDDGAEALLKALQKDWPELRHGDSHFKGPFVPVDKRDPTKKQVPEEEREPKQVPDSLWPMIEQIIALLTPLALEETREVRRETITRAEIHRHASDICTGVVSILNDERKYLGESPSYPQMIYRYDDKDGTNYSEEGGDHNQVYASVRVDEYRGHLKDYFEYFVAYISRNGLELRIKRKRLNENERGEDLWDDETFISDHRTAIRDHIEDKNAPFIIGSLYDEEQDATERVFTGNLRRLSLIREDSNSEHGIRRKVDGESILFIAPWRVQNSVKTTSVFDKFIEKEASERQDKTGQEEYNKGELDDPSLGDFQIAVAAVIREAVRAAVEERP